ncbi:hypothetical protein HRI_002139000 [Hibiscus trionum]|uniref:BHLH domain-containing protein n=1 Tax=Hibiscus trionum TaxID=183268 RepID=A0A9W7HWG5_HIBTR|nr:hypothetical protein HRI_002139000 [Hibiscus trionum]
MATSVLKQLLKSFCTNSPWTYAVLWNLKHLSPMSLTWEDGYCVHPIPREIIPSHFETGIEIGLVVANMLNLKYAWGEGVVGKVACSGNHCWVSCDDIFTGEANSNLFSECPEEWLLQFASGFKSIVLVPVLPHGVLQLGSLEMVDEDLSILAYIKDRFAYIHAQFPPSLLMSRCSDKLEESSSASVSPLNSEDSTAVDSVELDKLFSIQNAFQVPAMDLPEVPETESENNSVPPVSLSEVSSPLSQRICSNQLATQETELYGLSRLMEESQVFPECSTYAVRACGEIFDEIGNLYPAKDPLAPPSVNYYADDACFLSFPKDCELHKALGPAFRREINEYLWESSFLSEEVLSDLFDGNELPLSTNVGGAEYLLQAVVGQVYDIANISDHGMTSTRQLPSRPQSVKDDSTPSSRLTSPAYVGGANSSSKMSASSESTISILTDNDPEKSCNYTRSRKGQKQSSVAKRKARAGDKPRTRPRDRQLIHDRLKELRELVPNGAKCSIDALLDQTVNHMLHLRSVTNRSEKLRQWVHREVTTRKNVRSSEIKNGYQNRTSGFEIGDELKVCPIVVEDLAHQGHLLIEMLCAEHGLFLEIAQVIESFNLTILKGAMESYSNNTWAHFIVEASKDFHRLDIFWPLMQLLQRQ